MYPLCPENFWSILLCSVGCCLLNAICSVGSSTLNWFGSQRFNAISFPSASCLKNWGYLLSHEHICNFSVIPTWLMRIRSAWFWGKGVFSLHPTVLMSIYTQKVSPMVSITHYFTKQPAKSLFCNLVEQSKPELDPPAILSRQHLCEAIRFPIHWLIEQICKTCCGLFSVIAAVGMPCQAYTDLMYIMFSCFYYLRGGVFWRVEMKCRKKMWVFFIKHAEKEPASF